MKTVALKDTTRRWMLQRLQSKLFWAVAH